MGGIHGVAGTDHETALAVVGAPGELFEVEVGNDVPCMYLVEETEAILRSLFLHVTDCFQNIVCSNEFKV